MTLLSSVTNTRASIKPPRMLIYGPPKIGKSTFAAQAPSPIFVRTEDGLDAINANAFPRATTYVQVIDQMIALYQESHGFKTMVVDSLDWLETLIWAHVCEHDAPAGKTYSSIEDFGYGKGYIAALSQWKRFVSGLDKLRDERGMAIILIAHEKIARVNDPAVSEVYDRHSPKLHDRAAALVMEASDIIGFAHKDIVVVPGDPRKNERARAAGGQTRWLRLNESPGYLAGNRYGLPDTPLSWDAFQAALMAAFNPNPTENVNHAA
jgi:AAA domain